MDAGSIPAASTTYPQVAPENEPARARFHSALPSIVIRCRPKTLGVWNGVPAGVSASQLLIVSNLFHGARGGESIPAVSIERPLSVEAVSHLKFTRRVGA